MTVVELVVGIRNSRLDASFEHPKKESEKDKDLKRADESDGESRKSETSSDECQPNARFKVFAHHIGGA